MRRVKRHPIDHGSGRPRAFGRAGAIDAYAGNISGRVVDQSVQGRVSAVAVVAAVAAFAATALAAAIRAIAGKQNHQQASKIVVFHGKKARFWKLGPPQNRRFGPPARRHRQFWGTGSAVLGRRLFLDAFEAPSCQMKPTF